MYRSTVPLSCILRLRLNDLCIRLSQRVLSMLDLPVLVSVHAWYANIIRAVW